MPTRSSIKIGHVSPQTGPLAGFGEADAYILDEIERIFAEGHRQTTASTDQVEIIAKDSQSNAQPRRRGRRPS